MPGPCILLQKGDKYNAVECPADTAPRSGATFRARSTVPLHRPWLRSAFSFLSGGYVLTEHAGCHVTLLCAAAARVSVCEAQHAAAAPSGRADWCSPRPWRGAASQSSGRWPRLNLGRVQPGGLLPCLRVAVLGLTPGRVLQLWGRWPTVAVAAAVGVRVPRQRSCGGYPRDWIVRSGTGTSCPS